MQQPSDTIFALSSAPGRAGVAVVRVSGMQAGPALAALAGGLPAARMAALRTVRQPTDGAEVDRCIVLWFPAPASFTGEDVAEIHLHGGRAVIASVLAALGGLGCRLAEPGEFTRRAFDNGKLDLTEAEGIADLIDAETEAQRLQAVRQAGGALGRLYEGWRAELLRALALVEAAIDFSDEEDVADDALAQGRSLVERLAATIDDHLADGRRGEILREGYHVVLAGPPNAGKSSLINALARRDVAIVSAEAGTTRDVIEVRLDLGGLPVVISDTAGIREAMDADADVSAIEREGIRRTMAQGMDADLVVWMSEAGTPDAGLPEAFAQRGGATLVVTSKLDLIGPGGGPRSGSGFSATGHARVTVGISVHTGEGVAALVAHIARLAGERIGPTQSPVITQARHRSALEDCAASLKDFLIGNGADVEVRAEDLRLAAAALGRITGRIDAEQVLGEIFGRFCIGK